MNINLEILKLLQIAGGNFPIGGFSQSFGLETYIVKKRVDGRQKLNELLETYIASTICRNELPLLIAAFQACEEPDIESLLYLNDLSLATRITRESREASNKSGRAMIRIGKELLDDETVNEFYSKAKSGGIAYNVAFSIICQRMGNCLQNSAAAFVFNNVNGLVQAAVKLMPLGNIEGQQIFIELMPAMGTALKKAFHISIEDISNFMPAMDMASIEHETLHTRLYMS